MPRSTTAKSATLKETAMNSHAEFESCPGEAELDRLICRMAAHGSYGASSAAHAGDDRDADDGDDR